MVRKAHCCGKHMERTTGCSHKRVSKNINTPDVEYNYQMVMGDIQMFF